MPPASHGGGEEFSLCPAVEPKGEYVFSYDLWYWGVLSQELVSLAQICSWVSIYLDPDVWQPDHV